MRRFPEYIRFVPQDHVLVSNYLSRKVRGEALPFEDNVKEMDSHDVYGGGKKPWDLFAMHAEFPDSKAVYLFTTTPNPTPCTENSTGMINNNNSNTGVWKVEDDGASIPVEDPRLENQVVGFKKTFLYNNEDDNSNSNQDINIGWLMTEYTTLQPPKVPSLNYVLCKIEKIEFYVEEDLEEDTEEPAAAPPTAAAAAAAAAAPPTAAAAA